MLLSNLSLISIVTPESITFPDFFIVFFCPAMLILWYRNKQMTFIYVMEEYGKVIKKFLKSRGPITDP